MSETSEGGQCLSGWLRRGLGVLLLASAGLKAHGLWRGAEGPPLLDSATAQAALIEVEVVLALLLLSGALPWLAWRAATLFFAVMTLASGYLAVKGYPSCGCMGAVPLSPWWMFAVDLLIVVLLLRYRPVPQGASRLPRRLIAGAVGTVAILALIAGGFLVAFERPSAVLAGLRGQIVTVSPEVADLGSGTANEWRTVRVSLTNHGDRPVRIVGGSAACACLATRDLPFLLQPGESRRARVYMKFGSRPGRFVQRYRLDTDDDRQRQVAAAFAGTVIEEPPKK